MELVHSLEVMEVQLDLELVGLEPLDYSLGLPLVIQMVYLEFLEMEWGLQSVLW